MNTISPLLLKRSQQDGSNNIKKKLLMITQVGCTCHPKMTGGLFVFSVKCDSLESLFVTFLDVIKFISLKYLWKYHVVIET